MHTERLKAGHGSEPELGIMALGGSWLEMLPELLNISCLVVRSPAAVIDAARDRQGKFLLLSHVPPR